MSVELLIEKASVTSKEKEIARKVIANQRITPDEGLFLYQKASLHYLALLANYVKEQKNGRKVYFNRNFHIEPTNICIYNCKFCSYKRRFGEEGAWDYSVDEILDIVRRYKDTGVTEVHITGGVHPHRDVNYYCLLIRKIKSVLPHIHVKAFTAIELYFMIRKSRIGIEEGIKKLIDCGLDSLPGGGAEIFDEEIRKKISPDKPETKIWLDIHKIAHKLGLPSNATMLYGHIETFEHRIDHLEKLRRLQDETGGFNAFIPLKFRNANNPMSYVPEVPVTEDMRNYAVSRIYLDNIPHIKAYWVMMGRQHAQMALAYGVDDLDGTIDDTTKIYTMAGAEEQSPKMTASEMVQLIKDAGLTPVERNSVYDELKIYA